MTDLYIYPPIRAHIGTKHRACIRFFLYLHCCGDCNPLPGGTIEKGIRCKTGTVPAAVSPMEIPEIVATVSGREGSGEGQVRRPAMTR